MRLIEEATGNEAQIDHEYKDFRGDTHTLKAYRCPPRDCNSSGRVITDQGTFFPSVIGLKFTD